MLSEGEVLMSRDLFHSPWSLRRGASTPPHLAKEKAGREAQRWAEESRPDRRRSGRQRLTSLDRVPWS